MYTREDRLNDCERWFDTDIMTLRFKDWQDRKYNEAMLEYFLNRHNLKAKRY